jgi:GH25 family lysozyme M1 (1,4-beta-N-acetylmuramidase)
MLIADTNEFHPLVDAVTYKNSREADGTTHPIVIMRATYSITHIDLMYARSAREARAAGLKIGHYGYVVANVDAAAQGMFFGHVVKTTQGFKLGDSIWGDIEEGGGDQGPRMVAFLNAAHSVLHNPPAAEGAYSGAAFWQAHLGSTPSGLNRWIAAYGTSDPRIPGEDLWQFTDNRSVPGVSGNCDASIYKGTLDQFLNMVGAGTTPAPSTGIFLEDQDMHSLQPGERFAFSWPNGAKSIRFSTDAPPGKEVPGHIAWYAAVPNSHFKLVVGDVSEPEIPGGRGCVVHRDDQPGDVSAEYQFNFVASP